MRRTLVTVGLLLAVGTAGCSHKTEPSVATANTGGAKPSASANAGAGAGGGDTALKYSQCMRAQGLPWFPDPDPDGGINVRVPGGTDPNKVDKAQQACKAYSGENDPNRRPISADDLNRLRQMSQCMRDHGFPKYPDPDAKGGLSIDSKALGADPGSPAFQQAQEECHKVGPSRKPS